jgi:hypothetical protein
MRKLLALCLLLGASAHAQDVLTLGSAAAPAGGVAQVPVSIRDTTGTPLGNGSAHPIRGFAFKVLFPAEHVASITFARAGATSPLTPIYQDVMQGSGFTSVVLAFNQSIAFTNDLNPGNQVGTLTVTLTAQAPNGSVIPLTLHPPSAVLSNQSASVQETVSAQTLALVNGSVTVSNLAAPSNLVATAAGTSQVGLTWSASAGAAHYEVWRSTGGAPLTFLANAPAASYTDNAVTSGLAYLYRVRAVNGSALPSAFSNLDVATTVAFTDDPLTAGTVIKLAHITELRTAVNALRAAAGLAPLAADPTIAFGQTVRATHLTTLRTALSEARAAVGLSTLTFTDSPPVLIKAVHLTEVRNGTR